MIGNKTRIIKITQYFKIIKKVHINLYNISDVGCAILLSEYSRTHPTKVKGNPHYTYTDCGMNIFSEALPPKPSQHFLSTKLPRVVLVGNQDLTLGCLSCALAGPKYFIYNV